jgi:hypothetical protein
MPVKRCAYFKGNIKNKGSKVLGHPVLGCFEKSDYSTNDAHRAENVSELPVSQLLQTHAYFVDNVNK